VAAESRSHRALRSIAETAIRAQKIMMGEVRTKPIFPD